MSKNNVNGNGHGHDHGDGDNGSDDNGIRDRLARILGGGLSGGTQMLTPGAMKGIAVSMQLAEIKGTIDGMRNGDPFTNGDAYRLAHDLAAAISVILAQTAGRMPIIVALATLMLSEETNYEALAFYKNPEARAQYTDVRNALLAHAKETTATMLAQVDGQGDEGESDDGSDGESPTDGEGEISSGRAAAVLALLGDDLNVN